MSCNNSDFLPEFPQFVEWLRAAAPDLAGQFAAFTGIDHVLDWMQQSGRQRATVAIVGQDEFNYDFLVELEPGGRWLAFGVT